MIESDLLTADEAAKLLRISRRTFDGHVARCEMAYIAVGLGLQRVRKRFDPEDIARFREKQRRVECPPEPPQSRRRAPATPTEAAEFKALSEERRDARRAAQTSLRQTP